MAQNRKLRMFKRPWVFTRDTTVCTELGHRENISTISLIINFTHSWLKLLQYVVSLKSEKRTLIIIIMSPKLSIIVTRLIQVGSALSVS